MSSPSPAEFCHQNMIQTEIVVTALNKCPYLKRTPIQKLRKLSMMPSSLSNSPNALFSVANKCPVMKPALKSQASHISTSVKCPYASVVDSICYVGSAGKISSFLDKRDYPTSHNVSGKFDYDSFYHQELEKKKNDRSYRYFNNINRLAQKFPIAHTGTGEHVTVWCSNDYLGMSKHPKVLQAMKDTLDTYGSGAGGLCS
jgi:5-aminolevulinate synthase